MGNYPSIEYVDAGDADESNARTSSNEQIHKEEYFSDTESFRTNKKMESDSLAKIENFISYEIYSNSNRSTDARNETIVGNHGSLFKKDYDMGGTSFYREANPDDLPIQDIMGKNTLVSKDSTSDNMQAPSFFPTGPSSATVQPNVEKVLHLEDTADHTNNIDPNLILYQYRPSIIALKHTLEDSQIENRQISLPTEKPSQIPMHLPTLLQERQKSVSINIPNDSTRTLPNIINHNFQFKQPTRKQKKNGGKNNTNSKANLDYTSNEDTVSNQSVFNNVNRNYNQSSKINESLKKSLPFSNLRVDYFSLQKRNHFECPEHPTNESNQSINYSDSENSTRFREGSQDSPRRMSASYNIKDMTTMFHRSVDSKCSDRQSRANFSTFFLKDSPCFISHSMSPSFSIELGSENVQVIVKWRDQMDNNMNIDIKIISYDIASALSMQGRISSEDNSIEMMYDSIQCEWVTTDVYLTPGVYKLQFLIDGTLEYSNFLPKATDNLGNTINWFEVLAGYRSIEPHRDEIFSPDQLSEMVRAIPSESNIHLISPQSSSFSFHASRSITTYSNTSGIDRSNSSLGRQSSKTSKLFDVEPYPILKSKLVYEYTTDIPELFKFNKSDNEISKTKTSEYLNKVNIKGLNKMISCSCGEIYDHQFQIQKDTIESRGQISLNRYPINDLPVYLNTHQMTKAVQRKSISDAGLILGETKEAGHIISHVNLNHILTSSIQDGVISIACTVRSGGKFITQEIYSPFNNVRETLTAT